MNTIPAQANDSSETAFACDQETLAFNHRLTSIFDLLEQSVHGREEIECFIKQCFAKAYGTEVNHFMPRLLSLRSKRGDLIAAFGLRPALNSRLFLESYFEQSIEDILRLKLGVAVQRKDIIEVGNLSVLYPGAARWLIVALTARLFNEGYKWVVFTGTSALRNGFKRLGLSPVELGAARLTHLPLLDRASWGSYYDHAPMVMAGNIADGFNSLLKQRDLAALLRAGMGGVDSHE
ncbi:thermostable hemolysin [Sulfuriferula nivalis]|uniref:Thermostable hemolysin n=1 Tax=Sulfuriferula nivalis TaxID=2675298 RepID=A0A809RFQ4_9PROT|nr:thermostable hemolysin [Sulfuriferula nivalis]BBP00425.1 thermostable hemolysin [Sulfuriferula nivalis]